MDVHGRGADRLVTEKGLDDREFHAGLDEVRGKTVPEGVRGAGPRQPGVEGGLGQGLPGGLGPQRPGRVLGREQLGAGSLE
ncbi:MAG: hypothetical protein JWO38_479 [Gemmataceae bacterium]|nr:hypothetical protein [Gemmataceae bacterium]